MIRSFANRPPRHPLHASIREHAMHLAVRAALIGCMLWMPHAAAGEPTLVATIDDAHAYARYGQTITYVITLTNTDPATAATVPIEVTLSPAFDGDAATWQCFPGVDGVVCADAGSGLLADTAMLPPGARATWLFSVPMQATPSETTATLTFTAGGIAPLTDTNTLVIFKDRFDVPYADGTEAMPLQDGVRDVFVLAPAQGAAIETIRQWRLHDDSRVLVDRLRLDAQDLVRLRLAPRTGATRRSAWAAVRPGAALAFVSVDGLVLLEGAGRTLLVDAGAEAPP